MLKKHETYQINNLAYHLIIEQTKPKVSRRKEKIKIREEIEIFGEKKNYN